MTAPNNEQSPLSKTHSMTMTTQLSPGTTQWIRIFYVDAAFNSFLLKCLHFLVLRSSLHPASAKRKYACMSIYFWNGMLFISFLKINLFLKVSGLYKNCD